MIHCPKCNRIMMDTTQDGGMKLRSRMVLFKGSKAIALCPTCKTECEVPLTLNMDKIPPAPPKPFHYLKIEKN